MFSTDFFFFSSRRRHTRCALVTGVQTCALPIYRAEDVAAALGALHAPAIEARIAGVSVFERQGRPHMVWAGVEPLAPLAALHRKVDQCLARVGVAPETRAFLPHITLARLNRAAGRSEEPTSELQSIMRISYAVFCLEQKKKKN